MSRLNALRERLIDLTTQWDKARKDREKRIDQQLTSLINAEDRQKEILRLLPEIDEYFLAVLYNRIEVAETGGQKTLFADLSAVLQQILDLIRSSAPPEVQFINELIDLENPSSVEDMLDDRSDEVTPALLDVITEMVENLRTGGRETLAKRLGEIQSLISEHVAQYAPDSSNSI